MGILTSLRKKAVTAGLASILSLTGLNAFSGDREQARRDAENLRDLHIINQGIRIIQDGAMIHQGIMDYEQRERYLDFLRQQQNQQNQQNNQRQQNNSWIRGYVFNKWEDRDGDRRVNPPNELVGWNKNSFYENELLYARLSAGNNEGNSYSFVLSGPDNKRIYFDRKNIDSNNNSYTWNLKLLNQQERFLENNGEGVYTVAFFIDNECFNIRPFNWLKNRSVTTNSQIAAVPLPPSIILPPRNEEVVRYNHLLGYEFKVDDDARKRNVLVHKEDKNHDGDCRFWAGLILENRVDNFKGKDFGFSIYDSAGNRRAHWHGEISRNWRSDAVGSIAEKFSFHDYQDGEYTLVVKWPDETETSKVFYIRESNLLVR